MVLTSYIRTGYSAWADDDFLDSTDSALSPFHEELDCDAPVPAVPELDINAELEQLVGMPSQQYVDYTLQRAIALLKYSGSGQCSPELVGIVKSFVALIVKDHLSMSIVDICQCIRRLPHQDPERLRRIAEVRHRLPWSSPEEAQQMVQAAFDPQHTMDRYTPCAYLSALFLHERVADRFMQELRARRPEDQQVRALDSLLRRPQRDGWRFGGDYAGTTTQGVEPRLKLWVDEGGRSRQPLGVGLHGAIAKAVSAVSSGHTTASVESAPSSATSIFHDDHGPIAYAFRSPVLRHLPAIKAFSRAQSGIEVLAGSLFDCVQNTAALGCPVFFRGDPLYSSALRTRGISGSAPSNIAHVFYASPLTTSEPGATKQESLVEHAWSTLFEEEIIPNIDGQSAQVTLYNISFTRGIYLTHPSTAKPMIQADEIEALASYIEHVGSGVVLLFGTMTPGALDQFWNAACSPQEYHRTVRSQMGVPYVGEINGKAYICVQTLEPASQRAESFPWSTHLVISAALATAAILSTIAPELSPQKRIDIFVRDHPDIIARSAMLLQIRSRARAGQRSPITALRHFAVTSEHSSS